MISSCRNVLLTSLTETSPLIPSSVEGLEISRKGTIVVNDENVNAFLSFRNIPKVEVIGISEANTRFLIDNAALVMTTDVAKQLEEVLA